MFANRVFRKTPFNDGVANVASRFSAFEERMLGKGFGKVLGAKLVHVERRSLGRLDYRPELSRGDELIHGGVMPYR